MTDTASRPNLDHLSREDRIDIAVAEARGATWVWESIVNGMATLEFQGRTLARAHFGVPVPTVGAGLDETWPALPRVTRDPAAWGALMEEEGVWSEPLFDTDGSIVGWWGRYRESHDGNMDIYPWTAQVAKPGIACAVAFLAKHGVEVPE